MVDGQVVERQPVFGSGFQQRLRSRAAFEQQADHGLCLVRRQLFHASQECLAERVGAAGFQRLDQPIGDLGVQLRRNQGCQSLDDFITSGVEGNQ